MDIIFVDIRDILWALIIITFQIGILITILLVVISLFRKTFASQEDKELAFKRHLEVLEHQTKIETIKAQARATLNVEVKNKA